MALVLSLKQGDDVFIGDKPFVVGKIQAPDSFEIVGADGRKFRITDAESAEVLEDVYVSAGSNPPLGTVRLVIEAPKGLLILRGDKMRRERSEDA